MMVPKWFDKRPGFTQADNVKHLQRSCERAAQVYLNDASATPFGLFARHYNPLMKAGENDDATALSSAYGQAVIDPRRARRSVPRTEHLLLRRSAQQPARLSRRPAARRSAGLRLEHVARKLAAAAPHRGAPYGRHARRSEHRARRRRRPAEHAAGGDRTLRRARVQDQTRRRPCRRRRAARRRARRTGCACAGPSLHARRQRAVQQCQFPRRLHRAAAHRARLRRAARRSALPRTAARPRSIARSGATHAEIAGAAAHRRSRRHPRCLPRCRRVRLARCVEQVVQRLVQSDRQPRTLRAVERAGAT